MFTSYFIYFFIFGSTQCLTISTTEYIYPNKCNNITCSYETAIKDRTTVFVVSRANGSILFEHNIVQIKSSGLCLLDSNQPCNAIGICWCDPKGLSTRICYNHTSGGEGRLTMHCLTNDQHTWKLVTIAAIPSNICPNKMIFSVNEGNKFGPLICNASCGPPCTFRWVGLVSVINSSQLLINNAARTDNGPYQCEARNTIGTITANIDLLVYYGPDKVILSPNETSLVANEGSDFPSIKCKADCHPGCTLTWIKPNGIEVSTNVLILKNIKMNQTGTYTCNASNFVGNMVSAGVTINLIDSPTILKLEILNSNTVDEQHSVNFLCEVNGYPVPDISWILSSTNTLLKKDEHTFKSNYVIPKANCLHTGTYRCQGSNVIEGELVNAFREINLFVLCRARIDQRYPEVADDIAVIENGDLNIKVFLLAYPEPMIIWTMRSSATGQDYTVNYINSFNSVEHMSIVNITDFSTKHYGVYKIIAYNNIGPPYVKSFTVKPQAVNNSSENNLTKSIGASIGASFFILIVVGLTVFLLKIRRRRTYIKKENSKLYQSTQPDKSSSDYDEIGNIKDEHSYQDLKKYNKDSRQQLDTPPVYTNMSI